MITCVRCGICCKAGTCLLGKENSKGECLFLVSEDKVFSCKLYSSGIVLGLDIGIGLGCILRKNLEIFEFYRETYDTNTLSI